MNVPSLPHTQLDPALPCPLSPIIEREPGLYMPHTSSLFVAGHSCQVRAPDMSLPPCVSVTVQATRSRCGSCCCMRRWRWKRPSGQTPTPRPMRCWQAHFSRTALAGDLAADQRAVVPQATRLLQACTQDCPMPPPETPCRHLFWRLFAKWTAALSVLFVCPLIC